MEQRAESRCLVSLWSGVRGGSLKHLDNTEGPALAGDDDGFSCEDAVFEGPALPFPDK